MTRHASVLEHIAFLGSVVLAPCQCPCASCSAGQGCTEFSQMPAKGSGCWPDYWGIPYRPCWQIVGNRILSMLDASEVLAGHAEVTLYTVGVPCCAGQSFQALEMLRPSCQLCLPIVNSCWRHPYGISNMPIPYAHSLKASLDHSRSTVRGHGMDLLFVLATSIPAGLGLFIMLVRTMAGEVGLEPFGCSSAGQLLPASESLAENTTASKSCLRLAQWGALWHALQNMLPLPAFSRCIWGHRFWDQKVMLCSLVAWASTLVWLRRLGTTFLGSTSSTKDMPLALIPWSSCWQGGSWVSEPASSGHAWKERLAAALQSMQSFADSCYVCISLLYGMDPAHRD